MFIVPQQTLHRVMEWDFWWKRRKQSGDFDLENSGQIWKIAVLHTMHLAFDLGDHFPRNIEPFELKLRGELSLGPSADKPLLSDLRPD